MSAVNNPDEKHQYRNKGDKSFQMICGEFKKSEQEPDPRNLLQVLPLGHIRFHKSWISST